MNMLDDLLADFEAIFGDQRLVDARGEPTRRPPAIEDMPDEWGPLCSDGWKRPLLEEEVVAALDDGEDTKHESNEHSRRG